MVVRYCLNRQLSEFLCEPLKSRITYFLTRYHDVHNAYGRAAILLDKKELVDFTWRDMYEQDYGISKLYDKDIPASNIEEILKPEWDKNRTYSEMDFLSSVTAFLTMPISDALSSDDYIVRILAILDRRVGKKTLQTIRATPHNQRLTPLYAICLKIFRHIAQIHLVLRQ